MAIAFRGLSTAASAIPSVVLSAIVMSTYDVSARHPTAQPKDTRGLLRSRDKKPIARLGMPSKSSPLRACDRFVRDELTKTGVMEPQQQANARNGRADSARHARSYALRPDLLLVAKPGRTMVRQDRARCDRPRRLHLRAGPQAKTHALPPSVQQAAIAREVEVLRPVASHCFHFKRYGPLGRPTSAFDSTQVVSRRRHLCLDVSTAAMYACSCVRHKYIAL